MFIVLIGHMEAHSVAHMWQAQKEEKASHAGSHNTNRADPTEAGRNCYTCGYSGFHQFSLPFGGGITSNARGPERTTRQTFLLLWEWAT